MLILLMFVTDSRAWHLVQQFNVVFVFGHFFAVLVSLQSRSCNFEWTNELCLLSFYLYHSFIDGEKQHKHSHTHTQAGNLVCTHLKKLRKLIKNKSMELDEYDQGEDLVRKEVGF